MRTTLLLFFCFFLSFGQNASKKLDSLQLVLKNKKLPYQEQVALLNELSLQYQSFDLDSAQVFNNQILSVSKRKQYARGLGYYYQNLANVNMYKANFKAAEEFAKKSQFYFLRAKDTNNYILGVYAQTFALDFQGKYDMAKSLALQVIKKVEFQPNNTNIVELYYYLSTVFNEDKQPKTAFLYINKALDIYTKNKNTNGIFKCYFQFSSICLTNELYSKALLYLQRCDQLIQSNFKNKLEFLLNVNKHYVILYIDQKNYSKALQHALLIQKLIKKDAFSDFVFDTNLSFVKIYTGLKQYSKALQYVALLDAMANKSPYDSFRLATVKGKLYYHTKDYVQALVYAKNCYSFDSKNSEVLALLAAINSSLGNYKEAYRYQQEHSDLKEEQFQFDKKNSIAEYEALFQIKDKDIELKNTKLVVKNREIQLQQQNSYILLAVITIVALCIVFLLLAYNYHIKKKSIRITKQKNEALAHVNDLLTESNLEKEILLKEIHHRVKNNLQLVMSLLNIQAQDSQQTTIQEFLEKGRARIATMSLIHQSLYQSDNFAKINFQDYLENLITNIKDTFDNDAVDVEVNTNGATFDLDTAIPLGLIINELVCNALKHAFPKDLKGRISIAIEKKEGQAYELLVGDNGVGVADKVASKGSKSIGLELVSLLVMQLQGTLRKVNQDGTQFSIEFYPI